jgi:AraC-like DNA-binding protein
MTDGNRAEPTRNGIARTESLGNIRIFIEALERLDYDGDGALRAIQLRRSDLNDPDGRVPCSLVGAMFGRAMQERPLNNLGTRIAAETPIGAFPLIDYLVLTSESVGQGLKKLSQYFRLVDFPVFLNIREEESSVQILYEGPPSPFGFEFGITLCILHLREETANQFHAEHVNFVHTPDDVAEVEGILACPVRTGQPWNGWVISRDVWALPLRRRDPILSGLLELQAKDMLDRCPASGGTAIRVRRVLISRVAGGDTDIEAVARTLATSARSLQRQLTAEGVSYRELLEATRKQAAERYLSNSSLPITEVAYLLGYSEVAAFHRAFKRWYDTTPMAFRQRHPLQGRSKP